MTIASPIPAHQERAARYSLSIVNPLREPRWDAQVAAHSNATFFHTAAWARTLAVAYGFEPRYIAALAGHDLLAALPVIEARSWLRGTRGVSLPFTDECPPLLTAEVKAESLLEEALHQGTLRGWKYLELRGGLDSFGVPESNSCYGHVVPLRNLPDPLEHCENSVRRAIRKAERAGVTVEFGTGLESVRAYYKLHCRTRTRHGAPPQPFRFFEAVCHHVLEPGHGFVALARHQGRAIAGAIFFYFAGKAIYKFAASDERHQEFRGSNLVVSSAIRHLIHSGITELNFGRTSLSNAGLRRFKQSWGAKEYTTGYARYCYGRRSFVKTPDLAAGIQARVLAQLPVFLSRWIGRFAYPHMS